ncbi:MAG TPA: MFS transporter [Anaerolineaceae bacterium]|nr:MFS transporter [Anaerolineaceae bacterium]HQF63206.1 MFS transporter [Anaerolineaceae bacterium]HQH86750.1 MFS transporter [Anaerolineaceae bacterium]
MPKNRSLLAIFLVVFIDLLGFGVVLPLLPYYADRFGANAAVTGLLVASYAAAQFIATPILGRLSDRFGRRPILMLSIAGNVLGFGLLALANNLWLLFAARILAGLTGGNISVAQAYITDVTAPKDRARGLGMIGAAFGLGFIIGPVTGGLLNEVSPAAPALAAAGLSLLNLLMVGLWLPESLTADRRAELAQAGRPALTLGALLSALRRPLVGPLLNARFWFALAFALFQSVFSLYALYRFNLSARDTGFVLAYVGLLSVITQGGLIRPLTARFSDRQLLLGATVGMAVGLLGWAVAPSVGVLLGVLAPIAISGGIFNTVINSAISKAVPPVEVGGTLGIAAALESLTRVISPSVGGLMLSLFTPALPGLVSAALLAALLMYLLNVLKQPAPEPVL